MSHSAVSRRDQWLYRLKRLWLMRWRIVPFAGGALAAFAAISLYSLLAPKEPELTMTDVNAAVAEAIASITPAPAYSAQVYAVIQPSLVLIQARFPVEDGDSENGLGSGVVVNADGAILTSLHVVDGADAIKITFADGSEANAVIVATQPEKDIAVLLPDTLPEIVVPATLGNPNAMRVGDEVYAVGHPFGLYGSMSAGVISGFDRSFFAKDSDIRINGLIQIDAAINPGNSGGPLLNRQGQVVGIVTGILNPVDEEFFIGIGFAVPIDVAAAPAGLPPQ
jgi:S1-C subfamily serine protease